MITDDIGIWNDLGNIEVLPKLWLKLPITSTSANDTFRAYFQCSNWSNLRSYVLIRPRYSTQNSDQVGLPVRVYPSPIPVVFEIPILKELADRSIFFRDLEVYKVNRYKIKTVGISGDTQIVIRIEELWG